MSIFRKKPTPQNRPIERPLYLGNALVCVNCEHIYPSSALNRHCPRCASKESIPLSNWIPVPRGRAKAYQMEVM